jgi:hypothetical protein
MSIRSTLRHPGAPNSISPVYSGKPARADTWRRPAARALSYKAGDKIVSHGRQGFVVSSGFIDWKALR